ncbi:glycoside hydrolase family 20 protein [Streptomyces sp. NPDC059740]|uniref:beta-N-acetylhexosaminidase n=1 Tax=Streptomyces sp. NPDC059740 TaxID=3346926 RepID=UPI003646DBF9
MRKSTACAAVVAAALVTAGCGGDGGSGRAGPSPDPTWATVSGSPRTVPAVRSFDAAKGKGWRRTAKARVVVPSGAKGPLAGEARLLAQDLGGLDVVWGEGQKVRTGDVVLRLTGDGHEPDPTGDPSHATADEAYTLRTADAAVTITAATPAGVFYGTRTLVQAERTGGGLPEGTVHDRPDRARRGLILDIARKPYSADWIADRIREMGDLKLNELQLHFGDDQGWRIESDSHPEIVSRDHLSKAQVRTLLRLAASRHINVVPEIDSPGHLNAVIAKHPELQLLSSSGGKPEGTVDPTDPAAAKLVDQLLREYAQLFPGKSFHLGGDEFLPLRNKTPDTTYADLKKKAVQRYGDKGSIQDLVAAWLNAREKTVRAAGKTDVAAWNDGFFADGQVKADADRGVVYWTGKEPGERDPADYLKEGRKVVNANDEYLYYVLGEPNKFKYPTGKRIYESWYPGIIRGTKPVKGADTGPTKVVGGRFGVWGDQPDAQTPQQVADGIRTPLAATAQKLWNPHKPSLSWTEFQKVVDKAGLGSA